MSKLGTNPFKNKACEGSGPWAVLSHHLGGRAVNKATKHVLPFTGALVNMLTFVSVPANVIADLTKHTMYRENWNLRLNCSISEWIKHRLLPDKGWGAVKHRISRIKLTRILSAWPLYSMQSSTENQQIAVLGMCHERRRHSSGPEPSMFYWHTVKWPLWRGWQSGDINRKIRSCVHFTHTVCLPHVHPTSQDQTSQSSSWLFSRDDAC